MTLATLRDFCLGKPPTVIAGLGGEGGSILETGTTTRTGEFKAIQILEEAEFDTATVGNMEGLGGSTIPAGHVLHGLWTVVKLTSGSAVIYRC
jgi:hypothetical protein